MKKNIIVALVATWCTAPAFAGLGPAWAWDASKITNNGSVQIQSTNGSSTYNAVQNPTGAVAKTNQSALTQPPTVIIQATSAGYSETIPFLANNTTTIPTCPTGYTRIFSWSGNANTIGTTYNSSQSSISVIAANVGGSRWSLVMSLDGSGYKRIAWIADQQLTYVPNGTNTLVQINANADTAYGAGVNNVVAAMCSK